MTDSKNNSKQITRMISVLRGLMVFGIVFSLASFVSELMYGPELEIEEGLWATALRDLTLMDEMFIFSFQVAFQVSLLFGLFQIIKLCGHFDRGEFFTLGPVTCLERFAGALLAIAFFTTIDVPLINYYLYFVGIFSLVPQFSLLEMFSWITYEWASTGLLIYLIVNIYRSAIQMKQEMDLTI